ncbi:MAG: hypothetical protein WBJ45_08185 [Limnohabitans sp.]|uniref:hypothetical protein n=1 Tax=Limnohabitans sp. TaxID=1907725 RepID=UPI003BAF5E3B
MQRVTPYDTGKVKIGCHYQPKRRIDMSGDMERLQSSLLGQRGPRLDIDMRLILERAGYAASACIAFITLLIIIKPQ